MNNCIIGIVVGCVVTAIGYCNCILPKREQRNKVKELTSENRGLKDENTDYKLEITRNRLAINKLKERVDTLEDRQNKADEWFGSIIRHSRAQFDKEAVENFLAEQGMEEEL